MVVSVVAGYIDMQGLIGGALLTPARISLRTALALHVWSLSVRCLIQDVLYVPAGFVTATLLTASVPDCLSETLSSSCIEKKDNFGDQNTYIFFFILGTSKVKK